ncbi:MAG: hypothetical protein QOH36_27 [Actinomycetota bacterium]|nr:hypothetical protein [Actinomycetota bacterium]
MGQYDCGMGLCHEFGSQIRSGCDHPMRAGASACSCAECGVVCRGLFDGCPDVWARGPRPVAISATRVAGPSPVPTPAPAAAAASSGGATVTSLPTARTESAHGVRGGAAVAAIGPAAVRADAGNGAGQRAGARAGGAEGEAGGDAGAAAADPRREVFKWFEEAFEGVRLELQTLIASMTHQQAMLAELLDSRQAELRLALVAESLPDVVADAVRAAMDAHNDTMAAAYDRSHDRFRDDVEEVRAITAAKVDSLHESFDKMASVIAVHDEEAEQRESMRLGTLKGSVTRQITPMAETLARMSTRLDDLADRMEEVAHAAPVSPPAAASAPSRPARAPRTTSPAVAAAAPAPAPTPKPRVASARAVPPARPSPSAWAPAVAVGPVVARRVTSNRAAAAADPPGTDPEPMPKVSAPRKRSSTATANAAARRRLAQAAALPDPEPEPDPAPAPNWAEAPLDDTVFGSDAEADDDSEVDPEPEFEPEPEPAPVRPRRITTRRPAGVRAPAAAPAPPARARTEPVPPAPVPRAPATRAPAARIQTSSGQPNGSAGTNRGPAHDAARRAPTARVTAPRASAPPPPPPPPPEPPESRRILGRRQSATPPFQPPLDEPAEPLVTYELEDDARELFGIDDDDEGWAPPAWVSEAAAKRQSPGRGRTPR